MKNVSRLLTALFILCLSLGTGDQLLAQGVTKAAISGVVTDSNGDGMLGANVVAIHQPTETLYGTAVRDGGAYDIPNMRIGGPYTVRVTFIGYRTQEETNVYLSLGQTVRLDFVLQQQAVAVGQVTVTAEQDEVLNSGRTGAATYLDADEVAQMPSIKRSTRDLIRLDPRSDGNFSFGGRNWLYNNVSLDGSYFNNPYGLDDPAPGGQTGAEPVPFEAVEQVQVSIAPYDVRESGFTGANINTVTKSGTNQFRGSIYSYQRNESFIGDKVRDVTVLNPDLSFSQRGFSFSGPIIPNKLFFYINGEIERREDPGTVFSAARAGASGALVSRVTAADMDAISARLRDVYNYDTGPYEGYIHATDNDKIIAKLDWNISERHNLTFRYNFLDGIRELGPHPFAISLNNTGRGPNANSLPFFNSGYAINNELHSFALEVNSRGNSFANRFFASYNRFRDFRTPRSEDFPTIEIGEGGVTYTTVGHEPFSISNILDQDVIQITNNFSFFRGKHVYTIGANFESFSFFNSFNLFRHGLFGFANTYDSVADFLAATDPSDPVDLRGMIAPAGTPFKGEDIDFGQLAFYAQDEYLVSKDFNITAGVRVDFPIYFTNPVDNPYSRGLNLLDADGNPETVDQSELPGAKPLFSPRFGFNWDVKGDRSTQLRGGTGIFTGRLPFVWIGNNISNPGPNPNLPAHLRTGDINAMDPDFKWPQVWNTNLAVDHQLPAGLLGTVEVILGKTINGIIIRNANLGPQVDTLPDGRPFYDGGKADPSHADGVYVVDNTSEGSMVNLTFQLRKNFDSGLNTSLAYSFLESKNQHTSTEIASFFFQGNAVQGNPNKPNVSFSEFGSRHRIVGGATYTHRWSNTSATHFGIFFERAQGSASTAASKSRFSYTYAGDVNGDGVSGNDLIYIPRNSSEVVFDETNATAAAQWTALNRFIEQDDYLSSHRGEIAERNGGIGDWFTNFDIRIMQDFNLNIGGQSHGFQISLDVLNLGNRINSDWGVHQVVNSTAKTPLVFTGAYDATSGRPILEFPGASETFSDDGSIISRWQAQIGLKYFFN